MINVNEKLTVLYSDNGVFTDYSNLSASFGRDSYTISYNFEEDYIYIGFYKPINTFYAEIDHPNHENDDLIVEYYNGTAFTGVAGLFDNTNNFERSGFVRWDRNQINEAKTTINSTELYWYRLTVDQCTHNIIFDGLNLVFADDQDLKKELYEIDTDTYLPNGQSSHIMTHEACRDEIIQSLRADGRYKEDFATGYLKDITAFDLLDISQVKLAATYLAMAKIMLNISDDENDVFAYKHNRYLSMYNSAMKTMYLNVDTDDDGVEDTHEQLADNTAKLIRR